MEVKITERKTNKTGTKRFQDCCKKCTLNPFFVIMAVKKLKIFVKKLKKKLKIIGKLVDNFTLDHFIKELNYENDNCIKWSR